MTKWIFYDPIDLDEYTFEVNPSEGGSPVRSKNIEFQNTAGADGAVLIFEGRQEALTGSFSGVVLSEPQYEAMMLWFNKPNPIEYTDDLGRTFEIYITKFEPRRGWKVSHPWRHTYSVDYIVTNENP